MLVLPNVLELMERSELVDLTDAEAAVVDAQKDSDAETESVNATPTVRTDTVDLMAVVVNVVLVLELEPFAKIQHIPTHNNVLLNVPSSFELKSVKIPVRILLEKLVFSKSQVHKAFQRLISHGTNLPSSSMSLKDNLALTPSALSALDMKTVSKLTQSLETVN